MRIAQILNSKVHWIFEADEMPNLPPDSGGNPIMLIDITSKSQVEQDWKYDSETGVFSEPAYEERQEVPLSEVAEITNYLLDVDFRVIMIEMGL